MKKFNYGAKGWGIVIFCFFLFWVGSGCPVTSLNVIMSEYNAMYGWDIAVLNGFGTMANILSIIAAAVFGWWCKKRGPKSLILAGCIMGLYQCLCGDVLHPLVPMHCGIPSALSHPAHIAR